MNLLFRAYRAADDRAEQLADQALTAQADAHPLDPRPWQAIADTQSVPVLPRQRRRPRPGETTKV